MEDFLEGASRKWGLEDFGFCGVAFQDSGGCDPQRNNGWVHTNPFS